MQRFDKVRGKVDDKLENLLEKIEYDRKDTLIDKRAIVSKKDVYEDLDPLKSERLRHRFNDKLYTRKEKNSGQIRR